MTWEYLLDHQGNAAWHFFEGHHAPVATSNPTTVAPTATPPAQWQEPDEPLGTTTTPNLSLQIPATDSHNWQQEINNDLLTIDSLLSGNQSLPSLDITGPASIPNLSTWSPTIPYGVGTTVIFNGSLFSSLVALNLNHSPDTSPLAWSATVEGAQGPQGIQGIPGPPGGSFTYHQTTPSTTWTITHGLNTFPNVTVTDSAGSWVIGSVQYPTLNTAVLTFSAAFSGTAVLV